MRGQIKSTVLRSRKPGKHATATSENTANNSACDNIIHASNFKHRPYIHRQHCVLNNALAEMAIRLFTYCVRLTAVCDMSLYRRLRLYRIT